MGTRSVLAIAQGDGWKGRYCHWDGYPSNQLNELMRIIRKEGYERATQVLLREHYGWSSLNENPELGNGMRDGRFVVVPGYGVAYTTKDLQSSEEEWITNTGGDFWTEWAYVMWPEKIVVLKRVGSSDDAHWKLHGVQSMTSEKVTVSE